MAAKQIDRKPNPSHLALGQNTIWVWLDGDDFLPRWNPEAYLCFRNI
jgi:hypothetical protein